MGKIRILDGLERGEQLNPPNIFTLLASTLQLCLSSDSGSAGGILLTGVPRLASCSEGSSIKGMVFHLGAGTC